MIEWDLIEKKLGTWAQHFKPFYDLGGFDKIYSQLKLEGKNTKILPEGKDLFKAFELCPINELKTIIVGLSPYFMIKYGVVVADGLALSCSYTKEEQPSLRIFYDAIEEDLFDGLNLTKLRNPDLSFLAEQGVLLINAALTTPEGSKDGHIELWKPFMEYFFNEVLSGISGIPIVFLGAIAGKYEPLVKQSMNYSKKVEHPAASAYNSRPWKHDNMFSWINNILKKNNNLEIEFLGKIPF